MTDQRSNAELARCGCLECRVSLLVRSRGESSPEKRTEPYRASSDPVYRRDMIDSGHGALLP